MRAIVYHGPGHKAWEEVPKPTGGAIPCPTTQPALTEAQCAVVVATLDAVAKQAGEEAGEYAGAQGAAAALRGAADGLGTTKDEKSLLGGAVALAGGVLLLAVRRRALSTVRPTAARELVDR